MSNLDRLKKLPGSKSSGKKPVESDLAVLVKELQANALAQQKSQTDITAAIKQLSLVVMSATKDGFDVSQVVEAIASLEGKMAEKDLMGPLVDYRIDFERDKFHLMKTGVTLTAVPQRLN